MDIDCERTCVKSYIDMVDWLDHIILDIMQYDYHVLKLQYKIFEFSKSYLTHAMPMWSLPCFWGEVFVTQWRLSFFNPFSPSSSLYPSTSYYVFFCLFLSPHLSISWKQDLMHIHSLLHLMPLSIISLTLRSIHRCPHPPCRGFFFIFYFGGKSLAPLDLLLCISLVGAPFLFTKTYRSRCISSCDVR